MLNIQAKGGSFGDIVIQAGGRTIRKSYTDTSKSGYLSIDISGLDLSGGLDIWAIPQKEGDLFYVVFSSIDAYSSNV